MSMRTKQERAVIAVPAASLEPGDTIWVHGRRVPGRVTKVTPGRDGSVTVAMSAGAAFRFSRTGAPVSRRLRRRRAVPGPGPRRVGRVRAPADAWAAPVMRIRRR